MGKPGRPKKQTRRVHFRMNEADWDTVNDKAERSDMTMSEFFRQAALGKRLPRGVPAINREAWLKLAPLGSVLNQIAMKIHTGDVTVLDQETNLLLSDLKALIQDLRADLRGNL